MKKRRAILTICSDFCSGILFVSILVFSSCASPNTLPESSSIRKIGNVPFHPQEAYQCGPASLAGVLNYWGISDTPEEIAKEIFSLSAKGTLTLDMILYAQKKGMDASLSAGTLEDLKKNIDSGFPVIVLVDYGSAFYQANHFMVVVGYNEHGIVVNSGREQHKYMHEKDFVKAWKRADYWTLLIKKKTTDSRQ